jgi:ABC-type branched-subunit amino acid transport system ATPase component
MPISGDPSPLSKEPLAVDAVHGGYSKVPVLQGVSLMARQSQLVVVIGPNGSGKSTLLKAMTGMVNLHSGSVSLHGKDLRGLATHERARAGLAYVPQARCVFHSLTVKENLEIGGLSLNRKRRAERIAGILDTFKDRAASRNKRAGILSGGQRNILGVARALMLEPRVLLVDEPTAGLSPANSENVWIQLRNVAATGTAVVVVEQSVAGALANSDWCYVLVAGKNRLSGPPASLRGVNLADVFLGAGESEPRGDDIVVSRNSS